MNQKDKDDSKIVIFGIGLVMLLIALVWLSIGILTVSVPGIISSLLWFATAGAMILFGWKQALER